MLLKFENWTWQQIISKSKDCAKMYKKFALGCWTWANDGLRQACNYKLGSGSWSTWILPTASIWSLDHWPQCSDAWHVVIFAMMYAKITARNSNPSHTSLPDYRGSKILRTYIYIYIRNLFWHHNLSVQNNNKFSFFDKLNPMFDKLIGSSSKQFIFKFMHTPFS